MESIIMKHVNRITGRVRPAVANNIGTYLVLAGQILAIVAGMFADKDIFGPDEGEGEGA